MRARIGGLVRWLVKHAMRAFFPTHGDMPGVQDLGIDPFLERYQRETSMLIWIGLVAGAVVFAITPLFTVGVPLPSFWLGSDRLDRHAQRLAGHNVYLVRQTVFLLKMVGGICWGQHPEIRKRLALPVYPDDPPAWRTS